MDNITECANNFKNLLNTNYRFIISQSRTQKELKLDFRNIDFYHLAGLQHLSDLALPRNKKTILEEIILNPNLSDQKLSKSRHYRKKGVNIEKRISELRFVDRYLDTDNLIRIFTNRSSKGRDLSGGSFIDADYVIESTLKERGETIYAFLKERKYEEGIYRLNSFFVKETRSYNGDSVYWMLKQKNKGGVVTELYRHPNYTKP